MTIVSHAHKFIFLKTAKTAGTSIEVTLSPLCGPEDVVTPILPLEPGHEARNFVMGPRKFVNHMGGRQVRKFLGEETYNAYFKFCVEREPVDKCLSHFAMLKHSGDHTAEDVPQSWEAYVERGKFLAEHKRYTDEDGSLIVDRVIRYERLAEELAEVLLPLGVAWRGLTSRAKSGFRKEGVPRREDVTAEVEALIYKAFEHPANPYFG